jgi:hypothetical protein
MNRPLPGQRPANPFGSRFTRPGALPFLPPAPADQSLEQMAQQILHNGRTAIFGPHGSGKTTLLHALCRTECFRQQAISPEQIIVLRQGEPSVHLWHELTNCPQRPLLILDGYEQLTWWQRPRLRLWCRRHKVPLLVTSHRPLSGFSSLKHTPPPLSVARQLAESLLKDQPHLIGSLLADFDTLWHTCGGNMRDLWSTLYDRYELN